MDIYGIRGEGLSHNQGMETLQNDVMNSDLLMKRRSMDDEKTPETPKQNADPLTISGREAAEYCAYKKQKKVSAIMDGISRAVYVLEDTDDAQRVVAQALRLRLSALRMTPLQMERLGAKCKEMGVSCDCVIGGNGETLVKVKGYEAKCALRLKAKQLTLLLSPSQVHACRYAEIRKEIRRVRRLAKKLLLTVSVSGGSMANLARIARICSEVGVDFLSVPYFSGCERVKAELTGGVKLEIVGAETLGQYKKLVEAGVGRIVTNRIAQFHAEWIKEVDEITVEALSSMGKIGQKCGE